MGKSDTFDQAIADFSVAYADQNEKDHAALERAVRTGKVKAVFEETSEWSVIGEISSRPHPTTFCSHSQPAAWR